MSPRDEGPRRVLHVMNNPTGGAAESTLALIGGLAERGIESAALCHATGPAAAMDTVREAVGGRLLEARLWGWNRRTRAVWWHRPVVAVRESLRTGRGQRAIPRLAAWARAQQIELVHSNTVLVPEGARMAAALDVPHLWHLRELVGPGHPFRFWNERRFLTRQIAGQADALIANSNAALAAIAPFLPPGFAEVIPNGVDTAAFAQLPSPRDDAPITIGMVANLTTRWKNHRLFLQAAALVDRTWPARFVIVGHDPVLEGRRDPYAEELHRLVTDTGLDERVEFSGYLSNPAEAMAGLDLLVHPCAQESFGRVAIEAMAAARPVIGVAAGGIGEIVDDGETGILVPPDDPAALAHAIEGLLGDPATRRRLGARGREIAEERFGLDAHVSAVIEVYRAATAQHRSGTI